MWGETRGRAPHPRDNAGISTLAGGNASATRPGSFRHPVGQRLGANRLGPATRTFPFTPRDHAGLARVAPQRRGMRLSTHWAIVRRARLEGTRGLALGRSDQGSSHQCVYGATEMATHQNDHPQQTEPHEIVVKHPAPGMRPTEWGARIPALLGHVHARQAPSRGSASAGIITHQSLLSSR